jgi:hypothetical protein
MQNQNPAKICVPLPSAQMIKNLPLGNYLTSKCKRSDLWYAYIPSHKTANKQNFIKFTTFIVLVAQNAILVQGHTMQSLSMNGWMNV